MNDFLGSLLIAKAIYDTSTPSANDKQKYFIKSKMEFLVDKKHSEIDSVSFL